MITKGMHEILKSKGVVIHGSKARCKMPRVFNHDILSCSADRAVGNHLYSGRVLGASEHDDIVQLHPLLKSEWNTIVEHYARIGLDHSHNVIWDIGLEYMPIHGGVTPSLFFYGDQELERSGDVGWAKTAEFINSKNNFVSLAEALSVPVPKTNCYASIQEISSTDILDFPFPCYLKASISASGVGIYRCENQQQLQQAMLCFDADVPVQLQQVVDSEIFINMQYQVVDGSCRRLLATRQIQDCTLHQGDVYPAEYQPWEIVEPMAEWMANRGFKDILAFEVAVLQQDAGVESLAIACDPRYNDASYPTLIAMKLGINEWESSNFSTRHHALECLDLEDIEYRSSTGEGVILVNWGTILAGKVMLMVAGNREVRQRIKLELQQRL